MTATSELRREHAKFVRQASLLTGTAAARMTRETAFQARAVLLALDAGLVTHLRIVDSWLYPALAASADPVVKRKAELCIEDLGGLLGAWAAYRDRWDEAAILADPPRFKAATEGVIGALVIRIEMENTELYPLMDALMASGSAEG